MQGFGIYIYADGVRYDGQYLNDKKEGYGVYYWTDGRKYEGWWHLGKQHGLGSYIDSNKASLKFGLWEAGRRIKWFDEMQVKSINQGKFDLSEHYTNPAESGNKSEATFLKPKNFEEMMAHVKRVLNVQSL